MSRQLPICLAVLVVVSVGSVRAQPKDKQKEFAAEAMRKADVKDARLVETERLVVATALPEAKAKALAIALDKVYVTANKALKFEATDEKARLVVFTFGDLDQYRQFKRTVIRERPDDGETASFDVRRDDPYVALSPRRGEKNPNIETLAANEICRAILVKKGGNARLPEWMKDGFARAVQMRTDPKTVGGDRSAVARLAPRIPKGAKATPVADKAWIGTGREKDLVAASLMDFLTFGPGSEKLPSVLSALVPTAATDEPTFAAALTSDWTLEDLDRAWREWVAKGSPAAK